MNWRTILVWIGGAVLVAAAWRAYGWPGLALAAGGLVMWLLLHFTRMTQVLSRAADKPVGYVGSAVMLNAKLKKGMTLLHVVAMTRSLGQLLSPKDEQPELYRWTDGTASHVTCEFRDGRLVRWELVRPPAAPDTTAPAP
jgi:hypothetical protein